MPILKSKSRSSPEDNVDNAPNRKRSIFSGRNRSPPPTSPRRSGDANSGRRSFFGSGSVSDTGSDRGSRNDSVRSRGFLGLGRNQGHSIHNDPTIAAAHQKVTDAEAAEREADQALFQARNKVKEAKRHVEMLEREALEDAHRAKMKQAEAKIVRKSAKALGRHG
ncbi:hypothetical protein AN958_03027 [Leucoagaricus sp. SymC.cos]|nr:hypothetical protein AN958_03027 [Leucoagaricus sp. SymC.cos]